MEQSSKGKADTTKSPGSMLQKAGLDGFLLGIILMIILAYCFPAPGMMQRPISLEMIAEYGVSLIFFFYGLKLSFKELYHGLKNWRMHIVVQSITFIFFPLIVLCFKPLFKGQDADVLWLAVFFLAALPSTVSSSVVMVSIAGGNIPAAIFNASISSLIGVLITPLWMGLMMSADASGFDAGPVILKLGLQILLPVTLGLLLNKRLGAFAARNKKMLKTFDQSVILLIIYTSFCKSFAEHLFSGFGWSTILLLTAGMLLLFLCVFGAVNIISSLLGFTDKDRITVLFCGSKKSLVHGTVMSKVLFEHSTYAGIMLLPLMIYHALQLITSSIIAQSFARRSVIDEQ